MHYRASCGIKFLMALSKYMYYSVSLPMNSVHKVHIQLFNLVYSAAVVMFK